MQNIKLASPIMLRATHYKENGFSKNEFGKFMAAIAEGAVNHTISSLYPNIIGTKYSNEDINIISRAGTSKKIQIKFRQTTTNENGLYNGGIYLETTRRNSGKNKKVGGTGHIPYSVKEQDYFLICADKDENLYKILCGLSDEEFASFEVVGKIKDKYFLDYLDICLVESKDLEDTNKQGFVVSNLTQYVWVNKKIGFLTGNDFFTKLDKAIDKIRRNG